MNHDQRSTNQQNASPTDEQLVAALLTQHTQGADRPAFREGFSDRVMAEIASTRRQSATPVPSAPSFSVILEHMFLRLAPLAAAALVLVAAMNVAATRGSTRPLIDRALGLPTVTLASAYSDSWNILDQSEVGQ